MATRELQPPHFPATYGQRGAAPLTGLPLATHWPQRGGAGAPSPGPPPTGHLRPTWPSEAFGHLLPLPPPADRGLRTGGIPTPRLTDWTKGGTGHLRPPTGHPGTPQTFGSGGHRTGRGFCVQRADGHRRPCAPAPLRGPPQAHSTDWRAPHWPKGYWPPTPHTGLRPLPYRPTGGKGGATP